MAGTGKFITFEGIEGVGKSLQIQQLKKRLSHYETVQLTREPGGTPLAERIRDILLDDSLAYPPESELLLLYAGRWDHWLNSIKPALDAGRWVLSDRFYDASLAYQGGGRALKDSWIYNIHDTVMGEIQPDLTFLLDAPAEVGFARIANRAKDRIEQESVEFFERVRQTYLKLAEKKPERFCIIDATQPVDVIAEDMWAAILKTDWLNA